MTEVIYIGSSPPVSPLRPPVSRQLRSSPRAKAKSSLYSLKDFNTAGEISFSDERPAKRRRSASPAVAQATDPWAVFDLSSDPADFDIPSSSAPARTTTRPVGKAPAKDIDDIEFSSSAPQPGPSRASRTAYVDILSSDSSGAEDVHASQSKPYSSLVNKVLGYGAAQDHNTNHVSAIKPAKSQSKRLVVDPIEFSSQPRPSSAKGPPKFGSSKPAAAIDRDAKKALKDAEKLRKQEAKAEREREKQKARDLAEVNKSKANKKDTAKEMILQMPGELQGLSIGNQVEEYMIQHEIRHSFKHEEVTLDKVEPWLHVGKVVQWKRKVEATYDDDEGQWMPIDRPRTERASHVAVLLSGQDFSDIAVGNEEGEGTSLSSMKSHFDRHIQVLRNRFPEERLIYLIQGLHAWVKRAENTKNRDYAAKVRAEVGSQPSSQPKKRKAKAPLYHSAVTADIVEDLQLHIQVNHQPVVIHHTTSDATTASQILSFTQSLSSRPYRVVELEHNLKSSSFYMGAGQFKGGDDAQETFVRMLEQQQRVTPSIAQSIVSRYSSPRDLVAAFRNNDNMLLENMRKSTNKDGGFSDKRVGPVISKRMHKVFLGRDPEATSGMS